MAGSIGLLGLLVAFAAAGIGVAVLICGHILRLRDFGSVLSWTGRLTAIISFASLTVCCVVMAYCFLTDDITIQYVLDNRVTTSGALGVLYKISGVWAGRAGSLMFWAWLISLFGAIVSVRRMGKTEFLDNIAVLVINLVLLAFLGVMLFSESNMPFVYTSSTYFNADGTLTSAAEMRGMNTLLQHWAMAIHPPLLFLGYAGLTVPFAYAVAACVVNDPSQEWVIRSERYVLVAWFFLTLGIGLGAVWAYVVLGWGGYWGWDPVENASLLPWLVTVALVHSFTLYKRRGLFKKWAVLCACLAFSFCILGTFISRSGLVQSVHAFEGDQVSLILFGALIVVSLLLGVVGCIWRRNDFVSDDSAPEMVSLMSRDGAYFINNIIMVLMACLLAYMTIAQALPSWLPLGGQSLSAGAYEIIARPVGILYLLMMAVCPLLGWCKTDFSAFLKKARVPFGLSMVVFFVLAAYWAMVLVPAYDQTIANGGSNAELVLEQGPAFYYNGLALVAFFVASLLIFNSGYQLARVIRSVKARQGRGVVCRMGSCISHLAMGVLLVGLVGSSMYVTEVSSYLPYNQESNTCSERFIIKDYSLEFKDGEARMADNRQDVDYQITLDVYKGDENIATVSPMITIVGATQQQKYTAGVINLPLEDLFVVYQGVSNQDSSVHLDVRVNPLISLVWAGLFLLALGMLMSLFGNRGNVPKPPSEDASASDSA